MDEKKLINLVDKAVKKDNSAIEELYKAYYGDIMFICRKYNLNDADANDIAQETFIKAFQEIGTLNNAASFPGWISRIATNKCLNLLKHNKVITFESIDDKDSSVNDIPDKQKTPDNIVIEKETGKILSEIIMKLPVEQRVTIFLFFYQDYSVKEIAAMYGCSESTVRSRLNYAKKTMLAEIDKMDNKTTKNRCVALLPFLFTIFAMEREAFACEAPDFTAGISAIMSESITAGTAASGSAVTNAAADIAATTAVKTAASFSIGKIIGIAAGAIAVIGIGVGVAVGVSKNNHDKNTDATTAHHASGETTSSQDINGTDGEEATTEGIEAKPQYQALTNRIVIYNSKDVIVEYQYIEYDEHNNKIRHTVTDEEDTVVKEITYTYDSNQNLLEERSILNGSTLDYADIYEYHDNGTMKTHTYYKDDETTPVRIQEYDERGNLIKETYSLYTIEYAYDEKNRRTKYSFVSQSSTTTETIVYDDENNTSESRLLDEDEFLLTITISTYDERGNVIRADISEIETDKENDIPSTRYSIYEYDDEDRLLSRYTYKSEDYFDHYTIKYDANGNKIEEISYYWGGADDNKIDIKETWTYDENNNLLHYGRYRGYDGETVKEENTFTYDDNGNLIEKIVSSKNADYIHKYEYDDKGGKIKYTYYIDDEKKWTYVYENTYILCD